MRYLYKCCWRWYANEDVWGSWCTTRPEHLKLYYELGRVTHAYAGGVLLFERRRDAEAFVDEMAGSTARSREARIFRGIAGPRVKLPPRQGVIKQLAHVADIADYWAGRSTDYVYKSIPWPCGTVAAEWFKPTGIVA